MTKKLIQVPEDFLEFVKCAPVGSGVCCCGDSMEDHAGYPSTDHTPVDQWDYSLSYWLEDIKELNQEEDAWRAFVDAFVGQAALRVLRQRFDALSNDIDQKP